MAGMLYVARNRRGLLEKRLMSWPRKDPSELSDSLRSMQAIRREERERNLVELKGRYVMERREAKEKLSVAEAKLKVLEDAKPMEYDEGIHAWRLERDAARDELVKAKREFRMACWKWSEAEKHGMDGEELTFEEKVYDHLWELVPIWVKKPKGSFQMYGMDRTWEFPGQYEEMHDNVVHFAK